MENENPLLRTPTPGQDMTKVLFPYAPKEAAHPDAYRENPLLRTPTKGQIITIGIPMSNLTVTMLSFGVVGFIFMFVLLLNWDKWMRIFQTLGR